MLPPPASGDFPLVAGDTISAARLGFDQSGAARRSELAALKALPFTLVCIDCQRLQEQMGGGGGDFEADWESAYEHEGRLSDRELTLGDIDITD